MKALVRVKPSLHVTLATKSEENVLEEISHMMKEINGQSLALLTQWLMAHLRPENLAALMLSM